MYFFYKEGIIFHGGYKVCVLLRSAGSTLLWCFSDENVPGCDYVALLKVLFVLIEAEFLLYLHSDGDGTVMF